MSDPPNYRQYPNAIFAGLGMSEKQAAELELDIQENPNQPEKRVQLLAFYAASGVTANEKRYDQIIWLITNRPDDFGMGQLPHVYMYASIDPNGYRLAKEAWLAQTELHPENPKVLANAASFLSIYDPDLAEGFFLKAQALSSGNPWEEDLPSL